MRDPREPLAFALLILPCVVVVRFLAVAAHEVLGHGLFSMALGGSFYAVYLSPGQGSAYVYLAAPAYGAVDWASVAVNLAGIAVELLLGLAVLLLYPRVRGFVPRLFVLLLLSVLLVHTLLYMAVGALPVPGLRGDTANAVVLLKAPALAAGFVAAGALWAIAAMYAISRHLLALLGDALTRRPEQLYLLLFWILPLLLALPVAAGFGAGGSPVLTYLAAFLGLAALAYAVAARPAAHAFVRTPASRYAADFRGLVPVAVALALILPAWLGAFGVTENRAHGVLLADPPPEEESRWWAGMAVDADVRIGENLTLTVAFRFRGLAQPRSPLEERIWGTFDHRADYATYSAEAVYRAGVMFDVSRWTVTPPPFIGGSVWSGNRTYENARVIPLALADPADKARIFTGGNGLYNVTLEDPFKAQGSGFLDELNVSWDQKVNLTLDVDPGGIIDNALYGPRFVRLRNYVVEGAPLLYHFTIRIFP